MRLRVIIAAVLLGLTSGCLSYDIVQSNVFSNDDGFIVRVDYGRANKDHVNTFKNPKDGKPMPFKSRLVIDVTLPDGDTFTAWQCMNVARNGTMYKTDDEDWLVLVSGFTCLVYAHDPIPADPGRYREVYGGILCHTPDSDYKPNPKWRNLKKNANGKWK